MIGTFRNRLVLAPMAGISDAPFRRIAWEGGAGLLYSEMISASGLVYRQPATQEMLKSCISENPVNVQLFGENPHILAEAAKICEDAGARMLDINMGCPVKKVFNAGAGAALMRDEAKCGEIIRKVRKAITIPLSVKIRSGVDNDRINALNVAKIVEKEGADLIAVHPRTRSQQFGGKANWRIIAKISEAVSIPVIGNGDVANADDVDRMTKETGCDMIMIGRAVRGKPWIFQEILKGKPLEHRKRNLFIARHLEYMLTAYGEKQGVMKFRKHLLWYMKGFPGAAAMRRQLSNVCKRSDILAILSPARS